MFANLIKPSAGWYPDNVDETMERYWNGVVWTLSTRPVRNATAAIQRMGEEPHPKSWNRTSWSKTTREDAQKRRDGINKMLDDTWADLTPAEERSRERVEEKKKQRAEEALRNEIEDVHTRVKAAQDALCDRIVGVGVAAAKNKSWTHVDGFDHLRLQAGTGELYFWIRDATGKQVTGLSITFTDLLPAHTRASHHFHDAWRNELDELVATALNRINDDLRPTAQPPVPEPVSTKGAGPAHQAQPPGPAAEERLANDLRRSVAGKKVRKVLLAHTGVGRCLADIRFTDGTSTQVTVTDVGVAAVLRSGDSTRIEMLRAAASRRLGGI